jgi:hypothetical protein
MLTLRIRALHIALAVMVVGAIAIAAPLASASGLAHWFRGFWVGPAAVQAVSGNKVTVMASATRAFDFDGGQAGDVRAGPPVTVTGATVGDTCLISADRTAMATGDYVYCDVTAANTVNFWLLTEKTDNNAADAGFYIQVISHQ